MTEPLVIRGDARRLPLPDASVDLIVTSPPYFALRSYTDGGDHYAGQIGSEDTPPAYIAALVECTREWARVLKPGGSMFVDLGDKYTGGGGQWEKDERPDPGRRRAVRGTVSTGGKTYGMKPKSLMLLPERYRIACVDQLGLIARAVLVWSKPNGLPESVTDRVRRSHEDWVHLTKAPRYYAAVDEIREPHSQPEGAPRPLGTRNKTPRHTVAADYTGWKDHSVSNNPLGKLPGSVWEVPTEPLKVPDRLAVDHFAAFPSEWPRRLILGWSPPGVCTVCGEGRRPVTAQSYVQTQRTNGAGALERNPDNHFTQSDRPFGRARAEATITGYACACTPYTDHPGAGERNVPVPEHWQGGPISGGGFAKQARDRGPSTGPCREYHFDRWTPAPTRPAVVLDPFGGTGTTAHVAAALGRTGVTVDASADYCRLAAAPELRHARRRKVLGLDKPPPPVAGDDQLDLFGT